MAVEFLHELGEPFFKVASCDTNNFPYLETTAKKLQDCVACDLRWLLPETSHKGCQIC